jgi:hypothetical protein
VDVWLSCACVGIVKKRNRPRVKADTRRRMVVSAEVKRFRQSDYASVCSGGSHTKVHVWGGRRTR